MDLQSLLHCVLLVFCPCQVAAYVEKFFENDNVCSKKLESNIFYLNDHEEQSAMVIKDGRHFQPLIGEQEFNCQFTVTTTHELGIFAVIQRMILRKNSQGQCIDYVQFRQPGKTYRFGDYNLKIKSSDSWSSEMCGKINELETDINDDKFSSSSDEDSSKAVKNSYIDHLGSVEVKIHLGNRSIIVDEEPSFEVVFTAFKAKCTNDSDFWKSCGFGTCIYKQFFKDGKFNCPYKNCKDESGCRPVFSDSGKGNQMLGIKILAGIVAALSTMLIAIIILLWLLCYCGTLFHYKGHRNSHSFEMSHLQDQIFLAATAPPETDVKN